jgi:hypothetical protein
MIERHQDYILPLPPIPVGGLTDLPLKLDSDAPFLLRLVRSRGIGLSGWRFQTPNRAWQSSQLRTDLIPQAPGALLPNPQPSRGSIIYPQMLYPIGATIVIEIGNTTNATITGAFLLFRGSKLFPDGAVASATYPAKLSALPDTYPVDVTVPAVGIVRDNQLKIKSDADFVYRFGVADPFTLGVDGGAYNPFTFTNCFVRLRDEYYKGFSNDWVHINDLFGQGQPSPFQTSTSPDDDVLFLPGLLTPEIYIPRDHSIYFDVMRNDVGSGPINLKFRFQGAKVFAR